MSNYGSISRYLGEADNVYAMEAFARSQKEYTYDFGEDIANYTFSCDLQSLLLDSVTYTNGTPDLSDTNVIGFFDNYTKVNNAFNTPLLSGNTAKVIIPANRYTGYLQPHAKTNVVATVVSVEWTKADGDADSHRFLIIERWEPGITVGNPADSPSPSYITNWQPGSFLTIDLPEPTTTNNNINNAIISGDEVLFSKNTDTVTLYNQVTYTDVTVTRPGGSNPNVTFGHALSLSDNYFAVAERGEVNNVYVYNKSGTLLHTFPEQISFSGFAQSVVITDTHTVIGAYTTMISGYNNAGMVYVYDTVTGALIRTIQPPRLVVDQWFGYSVATDGVYLVIGAPHSIYYNDFSGGYYDQTPAVTPGAPCGAVLVYNLVTGAYIGQLQSPDYKFGATGYLNCGWSVAIDGNYIVAGIPEYYINGPGRIGAVHVYNKTTGIIEQLLFQHGSGANERYGDSVDIQGYLIAVGVTTGSELRTYNLDPVYAGPASRYQWVSTALTNVNTTHVSMTGTMVAITDDVTGVIRHYDLSTIYYI